ncbi:hypothetical protein [Streptomyces cellostaticus]|uniref:hypothetical protein n=1 Tax=Streptomyces cellostaticus TaxID=67285 RepID=UPI00202686D4|nr:hypothetical protein [Streptomyces cellostaticus]
MNERSQAPPPGIPRGEQILRDVDRIEKWSIVWTLAAIGMWCWFLCLMLIGYEAGGVECRAPLFHAEQDYSPCDSGMRQWPVLLGVLALAVIPTVIAAITTLYAKLLCRIASSPKQNAHPSAGSPL